MAKIRKKVVTGNGFGKINAIRPKIKARRGRMKKFKLGEIHIRPHPSKVLQAEIFTEYCYTKGKDCSFS